MSGKTIHILAGFGMLLMIFLLAADVAARGRGGGGRGGGGGFSRGGGGFSRGGGGLNRGGGSTAGRRSPSISQRGPASGGTFGRDGGFGSGRRDSDYRSSTRPGTGDRAERDKRPDRDKRSDTRDRSDPADRDARADQPDDRPNREDREARRDERLEKRQDYRNEYYNDRDDFYEAWRHYSVGTSITVVRFESMSCTTTSTKVGGVTYYDCGGVWYNRVYRGGSVNYVVVNAPASH